MSSDPGDRGALATLQSADVGVGIDGCRGGWVLIAFARSAGRLELTEAALLESAAELPTLIERADAALALIDMPIGLPESGRRALDSAARGMLPKDRKASVFPVPARAVLDACSYADACRLSEAASGVRLSRQTWNVLGRIRELDHELRARPTLAARVRESHPELVFHLCAQAARCAQLPAKRTAEGRRLRKTLLAREGANVEQVLAPRARLGRSCVGDDDLLDAAMLAALAARGEHARATLAAQPTRDGRDLRMELVIPREARTPSGAMRGVPPESERVIEP